MTSRRIARFPVSAVSADPVVLFIARCRGRVFGETLAQTLLREHLDDGSGHCKVCTTGAQSARVTFPCPTYDVASAAASITVIGGRSGDADSAL